MNNGIIRIARLQLAQDPDNIVKVAGILSRIKRWVLGMFDSNVRNQISVIDSKYSEIKGLVKTLQDNIVSIENSIDNVDIAGYDISVAELGRTLETLSERIKSAKDEIDNKRIPRYQESKDEIIKSLFKKGATLSSLGANLDSIIYRNEEPFYASVRNSPVLQKMFENNKDKIEKTIQELKDSNFINDILIPDILNSYKIRKVLDPIKKTNIPTKKNIAILVLSGMSKSIVDNKESLLNIEIYLDVFVDLNLEIEVSNMIFNVYKQHFGGIKTVKPKKGPDSPINPASPKEEKPSMESAFAQTFAGKK
jgi:hypothetical protein